MYFLAVICIGLVYGKAHDDHHHTHVSCSYCSTSSEHRYPACLNTHQQCHPDEHCYIARHDGALEMYCAKHSTCDSLSDPSCTTHTAGNCETCCPDDQCVTDLVAKYNRTNALYKEVGKDLFGALVGAVWSVDKSILNSVDHFLLGGKRPTTIKTASSHTSTSTPSTTTTTTTQTATPQSTLVQSSCVDQAVGCSTLKDVCTNSLASVLCRKFCGLCPVATTTTSPTHVWTRLLTGPCNDMLIMDGCKSGKNFYCKDEAGVSLCAETCGLCSALKKRFHNSTLCRDRLTDGPCNNLISMSDCTMPLVVDVCPATCNLCESLLRKEIDNIIVNSPW